MNENRTTTKTKKKLVCFGKFVSSFKCLNKFIDFHEYLMDLMVFHFIFFLFPSLRNPYLHFNRAYLKSQSDVASDRPHSCMICKQNEMKRDCEHPLDANINFNCRYLLYIDELHAFQLKLTMEIS